MLQNLYNELARINFKHHRLSPYREDMIYIAASSLAPEGIEEVMRIKEIADRHKHDACWDGKDIKIVVGTENDIDAG